MEWIFLFENAEVRQQWAEMICVNLKKQMNQNEANLSGSEKIRFESLKKFVQDNQGL